MYPLLLLGLAPLALSQTISLTINPSQTHQPIDGFGVSEAFQRALTIQNLPPLERRRALDLLFHPTTGAALSILRNGIGSSPDSRDDHMVSIQPRSPGSPTSPPSYTWDASDSGQLWLTTEAVHTYGVRTVYANAWSAPGYMKTNGNDANGGSLCGVPGTSCGDWRAAYADYLIQHLRYYAAANITITHLGFLNEPDLTTSYASMRSTPQQAASFMGVLRTAVAASNLTHKPLLTCCETMSWAAAGPFISAAAPDVATAHAYTSSPTSPLGGGRGKVWMTEAADNNGAWTGAWYSNGGAGEGWTWANNIHVALTQGNVSAYLYWIGAQDRRSETNSKLVRVVGSGEGRRVEASKRLWAMAGWSRFVRPGAVRVGVEGGGGGLKVTGFKGVAGEVVVVVVNGGSGERGVSVGVKGGVGVQKAEVWVTDGGRSLERGEVKVEGGKAVGSVPGRGMVTFVLFTSGGN